jgi:hypothetical protein
MPYLGRLSKMNAGYRLIIIDKIRNKGKTSHICSGVISKDNQII